MKTDFLLILKLSVIVLCLQACGPEGPVPLVPEPLDADYSGSENLEKTPSEPDNINDQRSSTDSLKETRLSGLPQSTIEAVETCEKDGHFYSLGDEICTENKPTEFPCRIDVEFHARIDQSAIESLTEYIENKAKGHQLYGCTEDDARISLHFYRYTKGTLDYKKLNVPKPSTQGKGKRKS